MSHPGNPVIVIHTNSQPVQIGGRGFWQMLVWPKTCPQFYFTTSDGAGKPFPVTVFEQK